MYGLPGALAVPAGLPFVGRSAELQRLRMLLPRAEGEERRVVLLGGDPGSGKSRLAREFAAEAAGTGALILCGTCDSVVRTPYGPFVEALQQLVRALDAGELRAALGPGAGELARLLPELGAHAGPFPPLRDADPDTERHRLHTAIVDLLAAVTRDRAAVLVIEDGHWADAGSLLLLRHLVRASRARLLLLVTFRDAEADTETLAELCRYDITRLRLTELTHEDIAQFVRRAGGVAPAELAGALHALTSGNAFLLCELWRALLETGALERCGEALHVHRDPARLGSPESVREVVSQRLARLTEPTTDLLALAAAAGTEFELDVVRTAAGLEDTELLHVLDEAVRSGIIDQVRGSVWRFAHELVRRALYDRLSGPRRAELHLRVGEALDGSGRIADLAHHFAAAVPFGPRERAIEYSVLAARAAAGALAFDEAAEHLRTALDLHREPPPELLLELGAMSHRAGHSRAALDAFRTAAELGRARGDVELFARAAIGYEEACWRPNLTERLAIDLLREAATVLGDEDSRLRVGALSGLARALDIRGHRGEGAPVRARAVAMARRLDDRHGLATALMRSYWSHGVTSVEEILAMLTEARDLGLALGDPEIATEAGCWRVPALVALGDLPAAERALPMVRELAETTAQPFMMHVAEHHASAVALCLGRLDEAETLARRSHECGQLLSGRDASGAYGIQMFGIRREQGRLAEIAPVMRILAGDPARDGAWRPSMIALYSELGMDADARRGLERVVADGLDPYRARLWLASLVYLTDAACALGDEAAAALLYPELEPYARGNVMIGHLVACYGAADRYLGMLAATLGEAEAAAGHFELALALDRDTGAATWHAHTAFQYGRFLLGRGRAERRRALALLGEAATVAERAGLPALLRRIRALGAPAANGALPDRLSPREVQILALVAEGMSNRQLGRRLCISEHTAANHVRSILRKTGCANRTEAAAYAHRSGMT
jgi:DNA-binding CsgD family transcriptional regulator